MNRPHIGYRTPAAVWTPSPLSLVQPTQDQPEPDSVEWAPDGAHMVFTSGVQAPRALVRMRADGTDSATELMRMEE